VVERWLGVPVAIPVDTWGHLGWRKCWNFFAQRSLFRFSKKSPCDVARVSPIGRCSSRKMKVEWEIEVEMIAHIAVVECTAQVEETVGVGVEENILVVAHIEVEVVAVHIEVVVVAVRFEVVVHIEVVVVAVRIEVVRIVAVRIEVAVAAHIVVVGNIPVLVAMVVLFGLQILLWTTKFQERGR